MTRGRRDPPDDRTSGAGRARTGPSLAPHSTSPSSSRRPTRRSNSASVSSPRAYCSRSSSRAVRGPSSRSRPVSAGQHRAARPRAVGETTPKPAGNATQKDSTPSASRPKATTSVSAVVAPDALFPRQGRHPVLVPPGCRSHRYPPSSAAAAVSGSLGGPTATAVDRHPGASERFVGGSDGRSSTTAMCVESRASGLALSSTYWARRTAGEDRGTGRPFGAGPTPRRRSDGKKATSGVSRYGCTRTTATMTHDTPDGSDEQRRWCENCRISVDPDAGDAGPECPSCGREL